MPLANAFLKRFSAQVNRTLRHFTPAAAERLASLDWPGNIRQLQNEIQRAVFLCEGPDVDASDLSVSENRIAPADGHDTTFTLLKDAERNAIIQMLRETGGNKLKAAIRLGISRAGISSKIKCYGIDV